MWTLGPLEKDNKQADHMGQLDVIATPPHLSVDIPVSTVETFHP